MNGKCPCITFRISFGLVSIKQVNVLESKEKNYFVSQVNTKKSL